MGEFDIDPKPVETPPAAPTETPPATPPADAVPEEFQDKSPQELAALINQEREARTSSEAERTRLNEAYNSLAMNAIASRSTPAPDPVIVPDAPSREDDPDGYIDHRIQQGVKQALDSQLTPLINQYRQDRSYQSSASVDNTRSRMRGDSANFPNFEKLEDDVMEFAKQFSPDQLAVPGALEECYYRVIGRAHAGNERERIAKEQSLSPGAGGRPSGAQDPEPDVSAAKLTDRERLAATRAGLSAKQFAALQGPGRVTLEEWEQVKEKAS